MIHKIAEYKIRKETLEESLEAIRAFVKAVRDNEPGTFLYEAHQKEDEISFIHFMAFRDPAAEDLHRQTEHVKKFVEVLYPNCAEEPVFTDITKVASTQNE